MTHDTPRAGEGDHGTTAEGGRNRWRRVMIELRKELGPTGASAALVRQLRPDAPRLVEDIVSRIQHEVPGYAGPTSGRRHRLIQMAVSAAVGHFLDMIEGRTDTGRGVDDLFRRMGYGEALDGNDLTLMRASFRIATHDSWGSLRTFATDQESSAAMLGQLGDVLFGYIEHLAEQFTIGFEGAHKALDRDVGLARTRLLDSLLSEASRADIQTYATNAVWPLPESFVVMSATFHGQFPNLGELETSMLLRADTSPALIICDAEEATQVADELGRLVAGIRIAVSWPVPIAEIPDAHRWATRTLQLVARGVIAPLPIIHCADHATQLWLHAEPALRRRRCQELLRPLLTETPNSREILSETLLAWLESRDSAPAIAARLGVHPQTVRYRWKRINELFGEDLHNSEFVVQVTMLLKASIPLWRAGDQSDFDRSWTGDGK